MKNRWKQFWKDESGIGVVEIILILVVLIMLVVIFREQITAIVTNAFQQINSGYDAAVWDDLVISSSHN